MIVGSCCAVGFVVLGYFGLWSGLFVNDGCRFDLFVRC